MQLVWSLIYRAVNRPSCILCKRALNVVSLLSRRKLIMNLSKSSNVSEFTTNSFRNWTLQLNMYLDEIRLQINCI